MKYKDCNAAVSVTGGVVKSKVTFPFSVGVSPMTGVNVGVSGTVLPAFKPAQLYEKVSVNYAQKGSFGLFFGMTKNLKALEARGIYYGLPETTVAIKAEGLTAGAPLVTVGGQYKLDKATKVKVVVAQKDLVIKAGVTKALRKGIMELLVERHAPLSAVTAGTHRPTRQNCAVAT
eukprot:SAG25_NODE_1582_length_2729_cov_2.836184_1_plen_174_part_10